MFDICVPNRKEKFDVLKEGLSILQVQLFEIQMKVSTKLELKNLSNCGLNKTNFSATLFTHYIVNDSA